MFGADVEAVDVVHVAVEDLADHRQEPPCRIETFDRERRIDQRIVDDADAVRVGQADRTAELASLADPLEARHLAVPVQAVEPAK